MRLAFTRRAARTQRRSDGTISVGGVRFEVPSRFRPLAKLTVRYRDWDKSRVHLVEPRTGEPLATLLPLDKEKNGLYAGLCGCDGIGTPQHLGVRRKAGGLGGKR
jgi:hypothetical protein